MCIVGGIAVGVFERIVLANVDPRNQSIVDLYLFVAALVLVVFLIRNPRRSRMVAHRTQVSRSPNGCGRSGTSAGSRSWACCWCSASWP